MEEDPLAAAIEVLDRHMAALNARSEAGLAATLHFPHYRLASGRMQVWDGPGHYQRDFMARAGEGWAQSQWVRREPIAVSPEKVHLDVEFERLRDDGSLIGRFRSIWVVARLSGRWGAQLRSSFAA
jgi:hypothetical protein